MRPLSVALLKVRQNPTEQFLVTKVNFSAYYLRLGNKKRDRFIVSKVDLNFQICQQNKNFTY